ncbi:MAG: right-handed parallel beta-helix repeat-containing protein [Gammaproteobacteria bacterium]
MAASQRAPLYRVPYLASKLLLFSLMLVWLGDVPAVTYELQPGESFEAAVEDLHPGDVLIVHPGVYADEGRISITVRGTQDRPVVIKAVTTGTRPHIVRHADAEPQNTINIEGASFLTIQGLEISSNGGDGVNLSGNPAHIVLEDLNIHDVDVGVNFRSDMHRIIVRRSHIYKTGQHGGTGEGIYVGCNNAKCAVSDSLIESNWIHNTENGSQGDGIEVKNGSHSNAVRNNVIHDTRYPCVLLYGTGGKPQNLVEGNVMWNCGETGMQAAADAVIRNNIVFANMANGFISHPHQDVSPGNLRFVHNTIVGHADCLDIRDWAGKRDIIFANNAIYCAPGTQRIADLTGVVAAGNVITPRSIVVPAGHNVVGRSAADDLMAAGVLNAYPTPSSRVIDAGSHAYAPKTDFDGYARCGKPDAGAYTWGAQRKPAWAIGPGFKRVAEVSSQHCGCAAQP